MLTKLGRYILIPFAKNKRNFGYEFKALGGNTLYPCIPNPMNRYLSSSFGLSTSATSEGFLVGYGTTPPTENDYTLEHQITSGISGSISYRSGFDGNGNWVSIADINILNTSGSEITISEIGLAASLYYATTSTGTAGNYITPFLLARDLLSSPITIPAGESAMVSYTFKTPYPLVQASESPVIS